MIKGFILKDTICKFHGLIDGIIIDSKVRILQDTGGRIRLIPVYIETLDKSVIVKREDLQEV